MLAGWAGLKHRLPRADAIRAGGGLKASKLRGVIVDSP
jgi:hypothetical protein